MTEVKKTNQYTSNGDRIETTTTKYGNGSSETWVRKNPDPIFKGGVISSTKTDSKGNSKTRKY
jgi:hypothetical protein